MADRLLDGLAWKQCTAPVADRLHIEGVAHVAADLPAPLDQQRVLTAPVQREQSCVGVECRWSKEIAPEGVEKAPVRIARDTRDAIQVDPITRTGAEPVDAARPCRTQYSFHHGAGHD